MPTLQQRMVDSTDPKIRRTAMKSLVSFLRDDLEDLAMKKLWRCVFFAMWLADMAPVQNELARSAGRTLRAFTTEDAAARWLSAFCGTVVGEWGRLDKYRVDKYYVLVRWALREALAWCAAKDWGDDAVDALAAAFGEGFLGEGPAFPAGVKLHYADIIVEELVNARAPAGAREAFLLPALALLGGTDAPLVERALERVCEPLAKNCDAEDDDEDDRGEKEKDDVATAKAAAGFAMDIIYGLAASGDRPGRHRDALYAAAKTLAGACGRRPDAALALKKRADPEAEKAEDEDAEPAMPTSLRQLKKRSRIAEKKKNAYYKRFK